MHKWGNQSRQPSAALWRLDSMGLKTQRHWCVVLLLLTNREASEREPLPNGFARSGRPSSIPPSVGYVVLLFNFNIVIIKLHFIGWWKQRFVVWFLCWNKLVYLISNKVDLVSWVVPCWHYGMCCFITFIYFVLLFVTVLLEFYMYKFIWDILLHRTDKRKKLSYIFMSNKYKINWV